jgi:hypothetical protein
MEINPNRNVNPALPAGVPVKPRTVTGNSDASSFEQSSTLNIALQSTPDVRPEVVSRAEDLVSSSSYPPREVIQRIANLLAANLITETN